MGMMASRQMRRIRRRLRNKPRAHMLHIGKTGGTALKETLWPVSAAGRYEILTHPHTTRLEEIPVGEKVFFVVRDPVERFVSGFNSRLRQGQPTHHTPWIPSERTAFEEFPTVDSLGRALWSDDVSVHVRALTAMTAIRHVRDSYWEWFRSREYFETRVNDILMIIWCPDMTQSFPRLREALGLPDTVTLQTDGVRAHRSPDRMNRTLSRVAEHNLGRWSGREFAFIDLCASLPCFVGPSRASVDAPLQVDSTGLAT
jgi:hypothetical protein